MKQKKHVITILFSLFLTLNTNAQLFEGDGINLLSSKEKEDDREKIILSKGGVEYLSNSMPLGLAAKKLGYIIFAEQKVLSTFVPVPRDNENPLFYFLQLEKVFAWEVTPINNTNAVLIKAPDLAKSALFPVSSFSKEELEKLRGMGYESLQIGGRLYLRLPESYELPLFVEPKVQHFQILVNKIDKRKLEESGFSVAALFELQSKYFSLFSQYNPASAILGLEKSKMVTLSAVINYENLAASVEASYTLSLSGTEISPIIWEEKQERTIFLESKNVDDTRVSVDKETIEAGKKVSIESLGGNFFRLSFEDSSFLEASSDVRGVKYQADVKIEKSISLILISQEKTNSKGFLSKKKENRYYAYILTIKKTGAQKAPAFKETKLLQKL